MAAPLPLLRHVSLELAVAREIAADLALHAHRSHSL
jgi:hypothetical protein